MKNLNRYYVDSSLHEKLKYLEKQKEDSTKERLKFAAEFEKTVKEAQEFDRVRTEQKMRVAETLQAAYREQESVLFIKANNRKSNISGRTGDGARI